MLQTLPHTHAHTHLRRVHHGLETSGRAAATPLISLLTRPPNVIAVTIEKAIATNGVTIPPPNNASAVVAVASAAAAAAASAAAAAASATAPADLIELGGERLRPGHDCFRDVVLFRRLIGRGKIGRMDEPTNTRAREREKERETTRPEARTKEIVYFMFSANGAKRDRGVRDK